MSIKIIKAGVLSSVQDGGRYGYQHLGINPCGAMDKVAAAISNFLVGNDASEAVIESHFPASQLFFEQDALVALTGADFGAMINDKLIPINNPIFISRNTVLQFTKPLFGAISYLAVGGGFNSENWLNSNSTDIKILKGGIQNILKKNTIITFKNKVCFIKFLQNNDSLILKYSVNSKNFYTKNNFIRFVEGIEYDVLNINSKHNLENQNFSVSSKNDRMGYHLIGKILNKEFELEMISSAVTKGTIQLLPNGKIIVLMSDHQTTGGYPQIANIISADLPKFAQLKSGDSFYFKKINIEEAEELHEKILLELKNIKNACLLKWQETQKSFS